MSESSSIFCILAPEDHGFFQKLEQHLQLLHPHLIDRVLHRHAAPAGDNQTGWVARCVDTSRLVLLLYSPAYFASDCCTEDEALALAAEKRGKTTVCVLGLRSCYDEYWRLAHATGRFLGRRGEFIGSAPDPDAAWTQVVAEIANRLRGRSPGSPMPGLPLCTPEGDGHPAPDPWLPRSILTCDREGTWRHLCGALHQDAHRLILLPSRQGQASGQVIDRLKRSFAQVPQLDLSDQPDLLRSGEVNLGRLVARRPHFGPRPTDLLIIGPLVRWHEAGDEWLEQFIRSLSAGLSEPIGQRGAVKWVQPIEWLGQPPWRDFLVLRALRRTAKRPWGSLQVTCLPRLERLRTLDVRRSYLEEAAQRDPGRVKEFLRRVTSGRWHDAEVLAAMRREWDAFARTERP